MHTFEIFYADLTPEARHRLLNTFATTPEEENWDIFPLAVIEREGGDPSEPHQQNRT